MIHSNRIKQNIKGTIKSSDYIKATNFRGDIEKEIDVKSARKDIIKNFPKLEIKTIETVTPGLDNATFLVNNEYIFRFPRSQEANSIIHRESLMLPLIKSKVKITVPDIEYIGYRNDGSEFTGHKLIAGISLEKEYALTPEGSPKLHIVKILKKFLDQIHSFDINKAKTNGVEEKNLYYNYLGEQKRTEEILFQALDKLYPNEASNFKKSINKLFFEYFTTEENFKYISVLCHGDLKKEHLIYTPESDTLSGIIDFGGLVVTDPDFDLWRLYFHYGEQFVRAILGDYHSKNYESLFKKLHFYTAARLIHYAVRAVLLNENIEIHMKLLRDTVIKK